MSEDLEPQLPTALASVVQGIIEDCDALSGPVRALLGRVPESDPLWDALSSLRMRVACLRSTAWEGAAVIGAMRVSGLAPMPMPMPLARPVARPGAKMRQAGDHSLDDEPVNQEVCA